MADLQWREKIKKVANHVENEHHTPQRAKQLGFGCFLLFLIVSAFIILFIVIGLFQRDNSFLAIVMILLGFIIIYAAWKLISADKLS